MKRLLLLSVLLFGAIPGTASSALATCYAPSCWGAIALNPATGKTGWSVNHQQARDARSQAVIKCGSSCKTVTFSNRCGAYAMTTSPKGGYGWSTHYDARHARLEALNQCLRAHPGQGCGIVVWACTDRSHPHLGQHKSESSP